MYARAPVGLAVLSFFLGSSGCVRPYQAVESPVEDRSVATGPVFYQEATWAPDGTVMLASGYEGDRYRIYRIRADGSKSSRLTEGPDYWTSWSPDGSRFAFHSKRDGHGEIYVALADGTMPAAVSNHPAGDTTPAWSPDGSRIAFVSDRGGRNQLFVMNTDGSNQIQLGETPGEVYNPTWSPDGLRLAFYSSHEGEDWLQVLSLDERVSRRVAPGVFPAWSPDGTRILFDRDDALYTITVHGSKEELLVVDGFAGRWSPDGRQIVFVRGNWPASELYLCDSNGANVHPLMRSR